MTIVAIKFVRRFIYEMFILLIVIFRRELSVFYSDFEFLCVGFA
jgi:hypothetical protein